MSNDYRILVAIDLKTGTDHLLAEAQRYAKAFDAVIDIVHVGAPDPDFVPYIKNTAPGIEIDSTRNLQAKELRSEHQQTQAIAARMREEGVRVERALTIQGSTVEAIIEEVQKFGADLLILGSHHHNVFYRLWFGDTAADAAKQPPCALLVIPL
jgi:nucleotide-binding universal stress UspA family protein